jgi:hypothetical protein
VGEQRQRFWLPCLLGCRRRWNKADRKASGEPAAKKLENLLRNRQRCSVSIQPEA